MVTDAKRMAVIDPDTGLVENVIMAPDGFEINGKLVKESDEAGIGHTYDADKDTYTAPPEPPEPEPVPYEPDEIDVRLKAVETKSGITQEDKDAARQALIDEKQ